MSGHKVEVYEVYENYVPSFDVARSVRRFLEGTKPAYLVGLRSVVLRNAGSLTGKRKRQKTWSRGRKVKIAEVRGCYHSETHSGPAHIEIFVDNLFAEGPILFRRAWGLRNYPIGHVLFHELGHHVHATVGREYKECEDVADYWQKRLFREYLDRKYPLLRPLAGPPVHLIRRILKIMKRRSI